MNACAPETCGGTSYDPCAERCAVCGELMVHGPRSVDWTHRHGDKYCGTGDGAVATP